MIIDEKTELQQLGEKLICSEDIFKGRILHVKKDKISLPNGETSGREYIRHIGAVCVIPITDDGKVIIERQFRYPIDSVITEIPAGKLDSPEEDRLEAAKRELMEETGISADKWTDLGIYYPSAAYTDEKITIYMAQGLHRGTRKLDKGEFLNVYEVPIEELVEDVMNNRIPDSKTQIAVLRAAVLLGKIPQL